MTVRAHWHVLILFLIGIASNFARGEQEMKHETQVIHSGATAHLTILHTNDIHGHVLPWQGWEGELKGRQIGGLERLATAIRQVRDQVGAQNVLLLDAGDAMGDTMIAHETKGRAILEVMNAMRYSAMTLANHEPDFSTEHLEKLVHEARFPFIAANVRRRDSGDLLTTSFVMLEAGGVNVGVLGLAYPNTPLTTAHHNVSSLEFVKESEKIVQSCLPLMHHEGAQVIVVLSHLGLGADIKLAEAVPGIDVIISGHSHNRMGQALMVGSTHIVQAGAHGSDLGRLDLSVKEGKVVEARRELVMIDAEKFAPDPQVSSIVETHLAPLRERMGEVLGQAEVTIMRAQTMAGQQPRKRDEQSPADSLFADIIREATGSDAALLPGVGYGVAIQPGPITAADLRNLIPHESKVITMSLNGQQIREILEQSVENVYAENPKEKVGGMIQVSGLRFSYDKKQKRGSRVGDAFVLERPLEAARQYRVATNSMLEQGGHHYQAFLKGEDPHEHISQYELVKQWLLKQDKPVRAPEDQRIISQEKLVEEKIP